MRPLLLLVAQILLWFGAQGLCISSEFAFANTFHEHDVCEENTKIEAVSRDSVASRRRNPCSAQERPAFDGYRPGPVQALIKPAPRPIRSFVPPYHARSRPLLC